MAEVLRAENISYTYQSKYQKVQALKEVSCSFETGKMYAIVGQSGSGKTTLLSMLAGLGTPTNGDVYVGNKSVKTLGEDTHRRKNVSVIYQSFNLFSTLSVIENVMYPMLILKKPKATRQSKAELLLESVGIKKEQYKKLPFMLSGGQQQRVAIARALASDAKIILADEPTGNLDSENSKIVIDIFKHLIKKEDYCVIIVTHDQGIANSADVVYTMKDGRLVV